MKLICFCIVLFAINDLSMSTINNDTTDAADAAVNAANKFEGAENLKDKSNEIDTSLEILDEESDEIDEKEKRFGSVLGKGFSFGKRFGSVLGQGMSFGKRFGSILGNGKSFGKRYGSVLGKGYSFGKRGGFGHDDIYLTSEIPDRENIFSELDKNQPISKRDDENSIGEDIEIVDLSGPVDEKKWVLNHIYGGFPNYKRSKRDTRTKRYIHYFGNMLGRGFSMGKKNDKIATDNLPATDNNSGDMDFDDNLYSASKVPGNMLGRQQRSYDRDQRRYLGNVLGGGFSFGKRDSEADHETIHGNGITVPDNLNMNVPNSEIYPEDFETRNENIPQKRYFLSSPGYRFGKRDEEEREKRFGFMLGRGLFGKRQPMQSKMKRPYGFVLGRGFSFGKRSPENTEEVPYPGSMDTLTDLEYNQDLDKRAGYILGRGYSFGKRGNKRFGWILGNGFSFGKRGDSKQYSEDVSLFIDDFGNIFVRTDLIDDFDQLNSEYLANTESRVFGCTGHLILHQADNPDQLQKSLKRTTGPLNLKKRATTEDVSYFIDDSGNIYLKADDVSGDDVSLFGTDKDITYYTCNGQVTEILGDNFTDENVSKRGWGSVLGRGFRFGKRFGSRKRFGHILGSGFSLGK